MTTNTPTPLLAVTDSALASAFREVARCSYAQDGVGRSLFDAVNKLANEIEARPQPSAPLLAIPEGWALVPRTCTAAMEDAGLRWMVALQHMRKQDKRNAMASAYEAMLSAAPQPPIPASVGEGVVLCHRVVSPKGSNGGWYSGDWKDVSDESTEAEWQAMWPGWRIERAYANPTPASGRKVDHDARLPIGWASNPDIEKLNHHRRHQYLGSVPILSEATANFCVPVYLHPTPASVSPGLAQIAAEFPDDGAEHVLRTYAKIHEGRMGVYWLWSMIEQIAAGQPEAKVLREYGVSEGASVSEGEELIAKWRAEVAELRSGGQDKYEAAAYAVEACADELQSALSATKAKP